MVLESDILKCVFLCQVTSNQLIPFMQVIMKKELKQLVRGGNVIRIQDSSHVFITASTGKECIGA